MARSTGSSFNRGWDVAKTFKCSVCGAPADHPILNRRALEACLYAFGMLPAVPRQCLLSLGELDDRYFAVRPNLGELSIREILDFAEHAAEDPRGFDPQNAEHWKRYASAACLRDTRLWPAACSSCAAPKVLR
jgi:hypothetical protein